MHRHAGGPFTDRQACRRCPIIDALAREGQERAEHGKLIGVDEKVLWERANREAERMLSAAEKKLGISYR